MISHDQLTNQLRAVGAEKALLKERIGLLRQELARAEAALVRAEANFALCAAMVQESARSEEFSKPEQPAVPATNHQA